MRPDRGISNTRSAIYLAAVWGTIIAALAACRLWPGWLTLALAFVVISSRQSALLMIVHECWHYSMFRNRRLNNVVGSVLSGWTVGSTFLAGRKRHMGHHRLLGSQEDPDHEFHCAHGKETRGQALRYFLSLVLGRQLGYALFLRRKDRAGLPAAAPKGAGFLRERWPDLAGIAATQAVLLSALWLAVGWWAWPVLWMLPLVTLTTFANGVRAFVEHYSFDGDEVSADQRLFTIQARWYERALFAPMNFNYHAEHHLQPAVSAFRLPALRGAYLAENRIVMRQGYLRTLLRVLFPAAAGHGAHDESPGTAREQAPQAAGTVSSAP